MWWLLPLVGGFVLGNKGKPTTKNRKVNSIGSRTGIEWKVDEFPKAGVLIVTGHGASITLRRRAAGKGFDVVNQFGEPQTIRAMKLDFVSETPKKTEEE
jgi:hypothetical protein